MQNQHVIGRLTITRRENITESTEHNIWKAVNKHSLFIFADPFLWESGLINVSRHDYVTSDGKAKAMEDINKLAAVLTEEGIPELGLNGEITLVTTDNEASHSTSVQRILVINNQVLYSQASLKWENYTVAGTVGELI